MTPILLTPGPLTTSDRTRAAMTRDWGSRDGDFVAMSEAVRARLAQLAGVADTHVAVPLPGSGTNAVEAAIQTLVPRDGHLLVLVNGAYGHRIAAMAARAGLAHSVREWPEDCPVDPAVLDPAVLDRDGVTDIAVVHCETTSGLLNPLAPIADAAHRAGRRLIVDAMSSFGAVPVPGPFTALVASANKGLEGVPGLGFGVIERAHLARCAGVARTVSLDFHDQWQAFESTGQYRFTPPVQVVAALSAALDQLDAEEPGARHARYCANRDLLVSGMAALGFTPLLAAELQAPVIVTFHIPDGGWFAFDRFYDFLHGRGVVIYPGKLTRMPSFRIGCIGAVGPADMRRALDAVAAFVQAEA